MKKTTLALLFSSLLAVSQYASANCRQATTVTASPITFDISNDLNNSSTVVVKTLEPYFPGHLLVPIMDYSLMSLVLPHHFKVAKQRWDLMEVNN